MGKSELIQQFIASQSLQQPILTFVIGLALTAFLAVILGWIYITYGKSVSNRRMFARNFLLVSLTTMFIITVVKSSLALSLGLVGALSIVRFRTAIKDPEELAYLFIAISIGLGMGADQWLITLIGAAVVMAIIIIKSKINLKREPQNLYITVSAEKSPQLSLKKVTDILKAYTTDLSLKRFDESRERVEISYLVNFFDFNKLDQGKSELMNLDDSVKVSFLDNKGIY